MAALPEVLFHYRVHPGQTTQVRRHEQLAAEGAIRILTALRRHGRVELLSEARTWQTEFLAAGHAAAQHRAVARRCLALGLPVLATYHAPTSSVWLGRRPVVARTLIPPTSASITTSTGV